MRKRFVVLATALALALVGAVRARAQELDPLLRLLVQNKVITLEQAQAVQAEYDRQRAAAAPAATTQAAVTEERARQIAVEETVKAKANLPDGLKDFKFGGIMFLSYQNGNSYDGAKPLVNGQYPKTYYSQFTLKRGYLDVEKKITGWLDMRFTPDIKQDSSGNWFLRTKYLYGKFHWKGNEFVSNPYVEVGSVHLPWIDFEEGMNGFRAQDSMFIERVGVMGSADLGVTGGFNLGKELPDSYKKEVNSKYAGRYGSFMAGIYNGGGYDAAEKNMNKVVMARVSVRPMPDIAPGFQVSLFGSEGKGNVADTWAASGANKGREIYPDYRVFLGMLSFEHKFFTVYGQYYTGRGKRDGSAQYADYTATEQRGHSFFTKASFPADKRFTWFARYDFFDTDTRQTSSQADETTRWISGVAWNLYKGNFLLLDYDSLRHSLAARPNEERWQLTLQVKF